MKTKHTRNLISAATAALALAIPAILSAADGTWTSTGNATWTTAGDPPWAGGTIADGSGFSAFFNTLDLTTDVTVTLGANRTIGNLNFGDTDTATAAGWTVTGNTLTLAGGTPTITAGALGTGKLVTINSILAGTSGLTKAGAGQLTVSNGGNGGLSGNIIVNSGLLLFNTTANYVDIFAKSAAVTVNAGAELRVTGGINGYNHGATDGAMVVDGGIFDYQGSTHGHMGNITLSNGATWKCSAGGGYNGENMQLNGTVTVSNTGGNTTASTMSNFSQGLGLNGNRTFTVADVTGSSATDLLVSMELEDKDGGANGLTKAGGGTMTISTMATYTGGTTVNAGTLSLNTGGGSGAIRGTVTVKTGATLALSAGDATGYNTDASRLSTINLEEGATLHVATVGGGGQNQTLGSATINMTGAQITGAAASSNLDFFAGASALNTLASANPSTITSTRINLRQSSVTFNVQDGAAATDFEIQSEVYGNALVKSGAGLMQLGAANNYTGTTTINGGTLKLGAAGTINSTGNMTIATGATFDASASSFTLGTGKSITGSGTVNGSISLATGTVVNPGTLGVGTLTMNNNLTMNGTATINLGELTGYTSTPALNIVGDLVLGGGAGAVTVNIPATAVTAGTYKLIGHANALADLNGFTFVGAPALGSRLSGGVVNNPTSIDYVVSGDSPYWTGDLGSEWSTALGSDNWKLISGGTVTDYIEGDNVLFNDDATTTVVDISVADVNPTSVEFKNSTLSYTLQGTFGVASGNMLKNGSGTVAINNANTFAGGTTINAGTLTVGNDAALGSGVISLNGGSLDLNTHTLANAIDLDGGVPVGSGTLAGVITGNVLTYNSPGNTLTLTGTNTHTGGTTLGAGTLALNASQALGTGPLTITGGALDNTTAGPLTLTTNNAQNWNGDFAFAGTQDLNLGTGAVTLGATRQVTVNAGTLTVGGAIGGAFGLTKAGAGTLVLSAAGTWNGTGSVNGGTLEVQAKSGNVTYSVAQGATLKVGYDTGGGYTPGVTLNGNGAEDPAGLYLKKGITFQSNSGLLIQTAPTTIRTYGTGGNAAIQGFDVNSAYFIKTVAAASGSSVDADINVYTGSYGYKMHADAGTNTATGDLTINGVISGSGAAQVGGEIIATALHKVGGGSVKLTNASTYASGTSINDGSIILAGGNDRLPVGTTVVLGNGGNSGRLVLGAGSGAINQAVARLQVNGSGTNNAVVGGDAAVSTLTINATTDATYSGKLGGTGTNENNLSLVKSGAGILTLSGIASHTGNTTVNTGKLTLATTGQMGFVIGNSAATNLVTGAGQAEFNGVFNIDTSAVTDTTGTWVLANVTTQSFTTSFSVAGFGDPESDGTWTKAATHVVGGTWTFDEADGTLKLTGAGGYANWADTNAPTGTSTDDFDGDGVPNGIEYVLGGDKDGNDLDKLPVPTTDGTNMIFTFTRDKDSITPDTTVAIQVDTDLVGWPESGPDYYPVPDAPQVASPGVTVVDNSPANTQTITLSVPMSPDAAKFARLKVVITTP